MKEEKSEKIEMNIVLVAWKEKKLNSRVEP